MRNLLLLLTFCLALTACKNKQDEAIQLIDELNMQLTDAPVLEQKVVADSLVQCYEQFVEKYPDHENSPEYLFKAGEVNKGLERYMDAIDNFSQLYNKYPEHDKAPTAMFLQGFIFHDNLKLEDLARKSFEMYLRKYPNHKLADDARNYLSLMDLSDDELLEFIKSKNEN